MQNKLCGRCARKDKTLNLDNRIEIAKSIVEGEVYECTTCNTTFYLNKYRMVYVGDKVVDKYISVLG